MTIIKLSTTMTREARAVYDAAIATKQYPIKFDCSDADGLESLVIDYIVKVERQVSAAGGSVQIINAEGLTEETLKVLGVNQLIKVNDE